MGHVKQASEQEAIAHPRWKDKWPAAANRVHQAEVIWFSIFNLT